MSCIFYLSDCRTVGFKVLALTVLLLYEALATVVEAEGFEERPLFILFRSEERHDESFAQAFGETEDEDDLLGGLFHLAVGVAEEEVVTAAAVDGIGVEVAGAVVEGHHATLLAGTAAVSHDEVVLLEGAGIDVDTAVLVEDRLGLDADVVCKDFLCFIHFN